MKKCTSFLIILSLLLTYSLVFAPQKAQAAVQATFYVSPAGNDSNPGTFSSPFKTLERARDAVRAINGNMTGDIIVYLRGGTYTLDAPFELTAEDSGSNGYSIVYQNYADEEPVISGGYEVTGWTLHDATKNIYRAYVGTDFYSRDLFVDGERATRARSEKNPAGFTLNDAYGFDLPSSGFYANMGSWGNVSDIELHQTNQWTHQSGSIDRIENNTIIMKQPFWQTASHFREFGVGLAYPQYIENAYELLDEEGEWYLNRTDGYLYYKPFATQNINTSEFILGRLEKLIDGNSTGSLDDILHNVNFIGLTFAHTTFMGPLTNVGYAEHQAGITFVNDLYYVYGYGNKDTLSPAALDFRFSKSIYIGGCTVEHIGACGVGFKLGSQFNAIEYNTFRDIGINGINIGDVHYDEGFTGLNELGMTDRNPTDPRCIIFGNNVSNNTITRVGANFQGGVGIFAGFVKYTTIDHNTIYDIPYTGISVGYGWGYADEYANYNPAAIGYNSITYNRIYNLLNKDVIDGGGIYTLGQADGSIIKYNYISGQNAPYGYIYLDSGTSYYTIQENVLSSENGSYKHWFVAQDNMKEPPLFIWAHDNDVQYNYYYEDLSVFKTPNSNIVTNNIRVRNNNWDAHALDIMACAGAGNGTISTYNAKRGPNLALGKTVTVSNYYMNDPALSGQKAVDGDYRTRWATGAVSSAWIEVDFGAPTTFNTVVFKECREYNQGIKEFAIQYWNGSAWVDVAEGTIPHSTETAVFEAVTAEKVRLYLSETDGISVTLSEFEVYNVNLAGNYVITNRATLANTAYDSTYVMTPFGHSSDPAFLIQWKYETSTTQSWTIFGLSTGIVNTNTSLVVTPYDYSDVPDNTLMQWYWTEDLKQVWELLPTGDGFFKLKNAHNGLFITPRGNSSDNVYLVQDVEAYGFDQHWGFDELQ